RAPAAQPTTLPAMATSRIRPNAPMPALPNASGVAPWPATTNITGISRPIASGSMRRANQCSRRSSRGRQVPNRKAPKMACRPIHSANAAQANSPSSTGVSADARGSPSSAAGRRRRAYSGLSSPKVTATSATAPATVKATPAAEPPPASASTAARKIHTTPSLTSPAPSASRPGVDRVSPRSLRMRASAANAETAIAAAMNIAKGQSPTPSGANARYSEAAMARPNANGSTMPNPPIEIAARTCLALPSGARSSAPTMNMNRLTPSVPRPASIGSDAAGNTTACTCGAQAPNTSGPSTRPAAISPITGGWPTWRNAAPQSFADASTSTSCSNSSSIGLIDGPAAGPGRAGRRVDDCVARQPGEAPLRVLQDVDETVDREAAGLHVGRRHALVVDVARVQRIASVHDHAIVDPGDAVDLLEQGRIAVDVAR